MNRTLILLAVGAVISFAGPQNVGPSEADDAVVAEIDGARITLADFEGQHPLALFPARNAFFDSERKAIEAYVDEYLLERKAKAEGVSVAELLKRHVESKIEGDPSDEALRVYYEGLDTKESFEAVRSNILQHIREKRLERAKSAYMEGLRSAANIVLKVGPPRASISLANVPLRGPADAKVTLVEYADYECMYCQQAQPDLDKLEAQFKGKIAFVYKDLPLPMHAHAEKAAEAALCAGEQNKYWEYHDRLFKTKELALPQLKAAAGELGLDTHAFETCLDTGQRADVLKTTLDEATTLGLQGTPTFFLNGQYFKGIPKYEQLRQMVEAELNAKESSAQTQHGAQQ
jgi:protein-disulfide isomerase